MEKINKLAQVIGKELRKKAETTATIPMGDFIVMLSKEIDEAINMWGGEEHKELKQHLLDLIEEIGNDGLSADVIADNFVVNGEFCSREEQFTADGDYSNEFEKYNGDWNEFCENEAVIYNDKFACINLGY